MNVIERAARSFDAFQQRNRALSLVFGVMKKFGDDNGGILVSSLAQTAFGALFPLLLLLVTIMGLVLSSHPALRQSVLHSTLSQFPIIGNDLASNIKALHRNSVAGLAIGIFGLIWGLARPGPERDFHHGPGLEHTRPGPAQLPEAPVAQLLVPGRVGRGPGTEHVLGRRRPHRSGLARPGHSRGALSAVVNFGEYLFAFRVLTPAKISLRQLVPGAVLAGIGWTVLQALGGFVVGHYLKDDSAVYGLFGIVLGLFAWIYLIAELTVYAAELNVVLARRLWPRAMVQPPLTDADRRSMAAQALQNQRRPEQRVDVSFDEGQAQERDGPRKRRRSTSVPRLDNVSRLKV